MLFVVRGIAGLFNSSRSCEQALRGVLAAGPEKGGELATTSLEFEYLHRKSRWEILIGGDDITLGTYFLMFVFIRVRFRLALIGGNLTGQSTGSHGGILEVESKFQRRSCKLSPPSERPGELARR